MPQAHSSGVIVISRILMAQSLAVIVPHWLQSGLGRQVRAKVTVR
jgi:hypothetical protein